MKYFIGIDIGTSRTTIYSSKTNSVIFSEPTCLTMDEKKKECVEVGFLADKMSGKNPYNYKVIWPVEHSMIADDDALFLFLEETFRRLNVDYLKSSLVLFTCPSNGTKVNEKMIASLAKRLSIRDYVIEPQAKIACLGVSQDSYAPTANLICHIGAGITDIAMISLGEIVKADSTYTAGNAFDDAIRRYLVQKLHMNVGKKSAESLKMRVANVFEGSENRLVEIKGRDTITSLPSSILVSSGELRNVLSPLVNDIAMKVTDVISEISPELVGELTRNGLMLSGGGAMIGGLKDQLKTLLAIPVRVDDNPLDAIADGMKVYWKKSRKE